MKNYQYTPQELESLSAYLDHELNQTEEAQMRSRLAQDANLRAQLEDLRLTRYTLRNTPKVRRQRSFVLTPEMVRRQKSAWRAFSFSRTISVAASVLFAVVLGGQVLLGNGAGMLAFAPQADVAMNADSAADTGLAEEPMMMMEADTEDQAADGMFMDDMAEESAAADSAMMDDEAPAADAPFAEMAPMPTQTLAEDDGIIITPEPAGGGGLPPTEAEEPAMEPTGDALRTDPIERITPEFAEKDGANSIQGDEMQADSMPAEESQPTQEGIFAIRWLPSGLLVIALLSAGLAFYFRRNFR